MLLLSVLLYHCLSAQGNKGVATDLSSCIENYNRSMPFEKLFIQTDKPYYANTDTIWFKAYLLNGLNNYFSEKSGLIYVELISGSQKVVRRVCVSAQIGLSWGQLLLDEQTIPEGDYTLRAYSNWMQNFGADALFSKKIYIAGGQKQAWTVSQNQKTESVNGKQAIKLELGLKTPEGFNYGLKSLSWQVMEGDVPLIGATNAETSLQGQVTANIALPNRQLKPLRFILTDKASGQETVIPVTVNRPSAIDLQFMPEGGYMVGGLPSRIGFKGVAENGLGTDVEGVIKDSKKNTVAEFKSTYKGMGSFMLVPIAGEIYTAELKLPNDVFKSETLPKVKPAGIILRVANTVKGDSVLVVVSFSKELITGDSYQLIGLVNNTICLQATIKALNPRISTTLAKSFFPSGIIHFTLFDKNNQPVCERATYADHKDNLQITINPSKPLYGTKDSIALNIMVKYKDGKPAYTGSLSLSVTDNSQITQDSVEDNLVTNMLLTSGVKGTIESPAHYLSNDQDAAKHLDLLLLTQGWTGYNWDNIMKPAEPKFKAEQELVVSGTATRFSGKPMPGSKIILLGGGGGLLGRDTLTDVQGRFEFRNLPKNDSLSFFVQATNPKGKSGHTDITLDEFKPTEAVLKPWYPTTPWYVTTKNAADTTLLYFVKNEGALQRKKFNIIGNNILNDVTVKAQKRIKRSHNLNEPDGADQVMDEKEIEKTNGEVPLRDFLIKNVKNISPIYNRGYAFYGISGPGFHYITLIVLDGHIAAALMDKNDLYGDSPLDEIKMKDVLGVEVMSSVKYRITYTDKFFAGVIPPPNFTYIEVTTRSGHGDFFRNTRNTTSYKPVTMIRPKEFYRPRYTVTSLPADILQSRATIHWQPHLGLTKNGTAFSSFYAADKPGTYTVIVQGTNLKGAMGYQRAQILVK